MSIAPEDRSSVKVRGPTPRDQPSVEIMRLRSANLMGRYPVIHEGGTMQSTLSQDDRVRLFMWGLQEHGKQGVRRTDRVAGGNPLTVADSARSYFQYTDTVGDARAADEKAKASLSGKEAADSTKPIPAGALYRIFGILGTGVVVIGAAYFFYKWWKKPGFF